MTDTQRVRELLAALADAKYRPGDHPIVPVRIQQFMNLAEETLPAIIASLSAEEDAIICEACMKPVLRGQFVHCYEDVGEVHVDCDQPNAFSDDPQAVVLVGDPLRRAALATLEELQPLWATVAAVETVPIDHPFSDEKTDPYWRIEIDGYCVDFDYQEAANNIANAINGRIRRALNAAPGREEGIEAAAQDIAAERRRQVEVEGWTPEHDDEHDDGALARAAACYAAIESGLSSAVVYDGRNATPEDVLWPFPGWLKPKGHRRNLVRAAALIVAEIERLDRAAIRSGAGR